MRHWSYEGYFTSYNGLLPTTPHMGRGHLMALRHATFLLDQPALHVVGAVCWVKPSNHHSYPLCQFAGAVKCHITAERCTTMQQSCVYISMLSKATIDTLRCEQTSVRGSFMCIERSHVSYDVYYYTAYKYFVDALYCTSSCHRLLKGLYG